MFLPGVCVNLPTDKQKEENRDPEVELQEPLAQLSESQASTQRPESDHERLTNLLIAAHEDASQAKNENEKLKVTYDELKAKHETDSICRTAMGGRSKIAAK